MTLHNRATQELTFTTRYRYKRFLQNAMIETGRAAYLASQLVCSGGTAMLPDKASDKHKNLQ